MKEIQLQRFLSRSAARRVRVRLTDNRRSVVAAEPAPDNAVGVTLHGMFLDAPTRVLEALARFVRRPEPELRRRVVRLYRQAGLDRPGRARPGAPAVTIRHKGAYADLKQVYDRLNQDYFSGRVQVFITWGRRNGQPGRRSVHFGSYNWDRQLIRVNPALDRSFVPRYFLEYIVYHEMLHAELGVHKDGDGHRSAHNPEFKRRETEFRHYSRAREWERRNLRYFLKSA